MLVEQPLIYRQVRLVAVQVLCSLVVGLQEAKPALSFDAVLKDHVLVVSLELLFLSFLVALDHGRVACLLDAQLHEHLAKLHASLG